MLSTMNEEDIIQMFSKLAISIIVEHQGMTSKDAKLHMETINPAFRQDVIFQALFEVCYNIELCKINKNN